MIIVEFEKTGVELFKYKDIVTIVTLEVYENGRQNIMILFTNGTRYFANNVKWRYENED